MRRPTSNINSKLNRSGWNLYLVTGRNDRINDNGKPKYNDNLYSNVHRSRLSSSNGNRNSNNHPASTDYRNVDSVFRVNIPISECSNARYME
jgi:hypothetical protein